MSFAVKNSFLKTSRSSDEDDKQCSICRSSDKAFFCFWKYQLELTPRYVNLKTGPVEFSCYLEFTIIDVYIFLMD